MPLLPDTREPEQRERVKTSPLVENYYLTEPIALDMPDLDLDVYMVEPSSPCSKSPLPPDRGAKGGEAHPVWGHAALSFSVGTPLPSLRFAKPPRRHEGNHLTLSVGNPAGLTFSDDHRSPGRPNESAYFSSQFTLQGLPQPPPPATHGMTCQLPGYNPAALLNAPVSNAARPARHSIINFRPVKNEAGRLSPAILPILPTSGPVPGLHVIYTAPPATHTTHIPNKELCSLDEILDELGIHERSLKFEDNLFPCPECHDPSLQATNLVTGQPLIEGYNTIVDLSQHLKTHPSAKSFQCIYCPFKADRKTPYLVHCWEKHLKAKPYKCVAGCGESFYCVKKRLDHVKTCSFCGDEKDSANLKCPHCTALFASERTLFEHVKTHPDPMRCRQCDKVSKNMGNFCAHWRMHTGVKPWGCLCGRTFSIKNSLKQHVVACQNIDQTRIKRRKKSGKRKADASGLLGPNSKRSKTEPTLFPLKRGGFAWPMEVPSNILTPAIRTKTSRKALSSTINMCFPAWNSQASKFGGSLPPPVGTWVKIETPLQSEGLRLAPNDEDARSPIPGFAKPPAVDMDPVGDMRSRNNLVTSPLMPRTFPSAPLKISLSLTPLLPRNNLPSFAQAKASPQASSPMDQENNLKIFPNQLIRTANVYRQTSLARIQTREKQVNVQQILSSDVGSPLQYLAKMRNQAVPPLPEFPGGSLSASVFCDSTLMQTQPRQPFDASHTSFTAPTPPHQHPPQVNILT